MACTCGGQLPAVPSSTCCQSQGSTTTSSKHQPATLSQLSNTSESSRTSCPCSEELAAEPNCVAANSDAANPRGLAQTEEELATLHQTHDEPGGEKAVGRILYGSQTGTAARLARDLADAASRQGVVLDLSDMASYEVEQLWKEQLLLLVVSTYEGGDPPDGARWFCSWLADVASDFRVGATGLSSTQFAVFGCGNSDYSDHFNQVRTCCCDASLRTVGKSPVVSCPTYLASFQWECF